MLCAKSDIITRLCDYRMIFKTLLQNQNLTNVVNLEKLSFLVCDNNV